MTKHRTQISLDDWQYESLKARAEREDRSLSDVIREAVTEYLVDETSGRVSRRKLSDIRGIASDPGISGEDHDRVLYGDSWGASSSTPAPGSPTSTGTTRPTSAWPGPGTSSPASC
jgi:hypothetical protein